MQGLMWHFTKLVHCLVLMINIHLELAERVITLLSQGLRGVLAAEKCSLEVDINEIGFIQYVIKSHSSCQQWRQIGMAHFIKPYAQFREMSGGSFC